MAKHRHFPIFIQTNNVVGEPDNKGSLSGATHQEAPYHNQLSVGQRLAWPQEKSVMKLVEQSVN
jgi:hypothetical protein